jgi:hypothetical protein
MISCLILKKRRDSSEVKMKVMPEEMFCLSIFETMAKTGWLIAINISMAWRQCGINDFGTMAKKALIGSR